MYVAVKGGERAIDAAHRWMAEERRGDPALPQITTAQIAAQLGRAVDRVMAEGALYDRELAARAIRQAQGDLIEAAFLLRASRATLPRLVDSEPVDTGAMRAKRRISEVFKDLPGGQRLGPTMDYTHRLLDPDAADPAAGQFAPPEATPEATPEAQATPTSLPRVMAMLGADALIEPDGDTLIQPDGNPAAPPPADLTMAPLGFPAPRALRLQALARGDEGFL
ncbi:MAG: carbon-phosphorus lyase complex subunit PhnI, partial [Acidiphilium sp. 21-68-69]